MLKLLIITVLMTIALAAQGEQLVKVAYQNKTWLSVSGMPLDAQYTDKQGRKGYNMQVDEVMLNIPHEELKRILIEWKEKQNATQTGK